MEEYRLIKKLPFENSPEIGYISKPKSGANNSHYLNHNWFKPENYPEFWEKVKEKKEYEILEFITSSGEIVTLRSNGKYVLSTLCPSDCRNGKGASLREELEYLKYGHYNIHSIKRISDGEVYTLGDKIHNYKETITEISLDSKNYDRMTPWLVINEDNGVSLKHAKKVKKPLFTTEDGVNIYEGHNYYSLHTDYNDSLRGYDKPFQILTLTAPSITLDLDNKFIKRFSTKEKAEKYIIYNKPVLSLQDIKDAHLYSGDEEYFKELVKSRL